MELFNKKDLEQIGSYLKKKNETIAVAESVTSGCLQFALSTATDASLFSQGGLTAYNIEQKTKHLAVEPVHALAVNCVSENVAVQMAQAAIRLFSCDWSIGITGYASPVPESGNKVFAYYAIIYKDKVVDSGKMNLENGDPPEVQVKYTNGVLEKLAALI